MTADSQNQPVWSTIILGSGPAGLTAAIYSARADLKPLVIQGTQPGGQLTTTTDIENFPGFPEGINGPELMQQMEEQARRFGTEFAFNQVEEVDLSQRPFVLQAGDDRYLCHSLIISTGAAPRLLGLDKEKEFYGQGVSTCATCDGFFYRGKEVAIVGGGDSAMEEATFLTRFANRVHVIHRRGELRASPAMQKRALNNDKITFHWHSVVDDILGDKQKGVQGVRLKNRQSDELTDLEVDGLFIAIGHIPNTGLFKGQLAMNEEDYLLPQHHTAMEVEGVFAAGDVQDDEFRQAITAAGSGCMAAIQAQRYLEANEL